MNKGEILCLGIGQAGAILADEMKTNVKRYTTAYINSSIGDLAGLNYANIDNNVFIYSGADGSGGNRQKSKIYYKNDEYRLASFINKYRQFKYFKIFFSTDGGTASGCISEVCNLIKKVLPKTNIELIGILPKLDLPDSNLSNSLECASELIENRDCYTSIRFIDNDKMIGKNYSDINKKAIKILDLSYGMMGHDKEGNSIDEEDLGRVYKSNGYNVSLNLNLSHTISDAIKSAVVDSVFCIPVDLSCDYGAINIDKKSDYNLENIASKFKADYRIFKTYNQKGFNIITLSGCELPNESFLAIKEELEVRKTERTVHHRNKGFDIDLGIKNKSKLESNNIDTKKETTFVDDEDIDALLNFDDFDL